MQYSKPSVSNQFFGDAMPFSHDGVFHLVILLDENHHAAFGGLGGHRWDHYTSSDLRSWVHQPLILAPGTPNAWDRYGICTGSVFFHDQLFYAFYAARVALTEGWSHFISEKVGVARSGDCIHFVKAPEPILEPPPGYARDHRDPFVFRHEATGLFHMLVTARLLPGHSTEAEGCLAHYTSTNLQQWSAHPPFGALLFGEAPECPDHFKWNDWYYLLVSQGGMATYYMSKDPLGPWMRPQVNSFEGHMAAVMRTAAWKDNRRIGVAFVRSRKDDLNKGDWTYAGNALFRELVQQTDGTLAVRFVPEMIPAAGVRLPLHFSSAGGGILADCGVELSANAQAGVHHVPLDAHITFVVRCDTSSRGFSLFLRADDRGENGAELQWDVAAMCVGLNGGALSRAADPVRSHNFIPLPGVPGNEHRVEIVLFKDMIDVCIDDCRCIVNRLPEARGANLFFRAEAGAVSIDRFSIRSIAG